MFGKRKSKEIRNSEVQGVKKKNDKAKCFDLSNLIERMEQTFKLDPLVRLNVDSTAAGEL